MPTYGFELRVTRPDMDPGTCGVHRVEFEARDADTASIMIDGWAAVEGLTIAGRKLLADGVTFREAGKRRALAIAGKMITLYGAVVEEFDDPEGSVGVRVILLNGKGVSLASDGSLLNDPAPAVEALAFDADESWLGHPQRSVGAEQVSSMIDDLLK